MLKSNVTGVFKDRATIIGVTAVEVSGETTFIELFMTNYLAEKFARYKIFERIG